MSSSQGKIAVKDLPFYKSDEEHHIYVDDPPHFLQSFVSKQWAYLEPTYVVLRDGYVFWSGISRQVTDNAKNYFILELPDYFTDESKIVVTKAVAITLGGMGGYLLGMRRGGRIGRAYYSGVGMAFLAAFCYPHETMDIGRSIARNIKLRWHEIIPPSLPSYSPPPTLPEKLESVDDKTIDIAIKKK